MMTAEQRQFAEVVFPGFAIGMGVGVLMGGLALAAGLGPGYAIATVLTLGVPLAIFGVGYSLLLARGTIRLGGVTPAALYWLFAFPTARLLHEVAFDVASGHPISLPDGLLPFLAYQAILSLGFAIGFVWIHENMFPKWWIRLRDHNAVAARYVVQYKSQAVAMEERKKRTQKKRDERKRTKDVRVHNFDREVMTAPRRRSRRK